MALMVSRHQASQADRQKNSGSYQFYGLPKNTSTGLEGLFNLQVHEAEVLQ